MPSYMNGSLCLTEKETAIFLERLTKPDALAIERRDAFLADISQTLTITQDNGGVYVEFPSEERSPAIITNTYNVCKPKQFIYSGYAKEISDNIKFEPQASDGKSRIRYSMKTENESVRFELPLSA